MTTQNSPRYIGAAETAKLIRKRLKKLFPETRFSVVTDTYAGGASIRIKWQDGPTGKAVDQAVAPYSGRRFDGMIDMAYGVSSWLLSTGEAFLGKSPGSEGQRGVHEGYDFNPPKGAELVHFGASYIFTDRCLSAAELGKLANRVAKEHGIDPGEIRLSARQANSFIESAWIQEAPKVWIHNADFSTLVHRASADLDLTPKKEAA